MVILTKYYTNFEQTITFANQTRYRNIKFRVVLHH